MARFFIDRPIFAWVIALFIMVMGGVAITQLPIAQYPTVAPPSIVISAAYPGASAQTLEDTVISVIEREMNGSPGLIYMESTSQANGTGSITLTFETGTNPDLAQVDVQNRLARATPRLPAAVTQQGVRVDKARANFLLFTILSSDDPKWDPIALGDYASRTVLPEIQRIKGVGQAQLFGTERAMRIWIDPAKLVGFNLSPADVNTAIRSQNAQVASGTIGDLPLRPARRSPPPSSSPASSPRPSSSATSSCAPIRRLDRAPERRRPHRTRRPDLRHVGAPERQAGHRYRRAALAHRQRAGNGQAVRQRMDGTVEVFPARREMRRPVRQLEVRRHLDRASGAYPDRGDPAGVRRDVPVPAELPLHDHPDHRGAGRAARFLATLLALGFSINVLTMFGMVLVIGIVVDDAIVVVENVERIMSEEGLSPLLGHAQGHGPDLRAPSSA